MPKAELHLHLEASVEWNVVRDALHRHTGDEYPESPFWLEPDFRFASWDDFRQLFRDYIGPWVAAPTGYAELIPAIGDLLVGQNIRYAEVNVGLNVFGRANVEPEMVLDLLGAEAERAAGRGTTIRWIGGVNREEGTEVTASWIQKVFHSPVISGFDLHGTEPGWPADLFTDVFAPVVEAGKKLKMHAGEMAGPDYIRAAVEVGSTQIGHGTSAVQDPGTMAMLRDRDIVVEVCPTSNERLRNIPNYGEHPICEMEEGGVKITLNSDDALFFGPDLTGEMARMIAERGTTAATLARWMRNAIEVALIEEEERQRFLADLDAWLADQGVLSDESEACASD
jgi:adenosine deaminase